MLVHGVDISTLEGWMVKINNNPSMFGKSMNRRWFRVAFVPAGNDQKLVISYAKTKTAKEPRGWLYLEDVSGVYCRRDMIEVVSPARTLRFKGETTAEHRLWSDSLHKLCNPPKALSKLSIEEDEKHRKLEAEEVLAQQRSDRDRIADPKRAEFSEPRSGAEKKQMHSEHKQKRDEQPEEERAREKSRQAQQQPSEATIGDGCRDGTGSRGRSASPPRSRRDRLDSRHSRSDSESDSDRGGRRRHGDDDEPRSRAQAARQSLTNARNAEAASSPREHCEAEREASTTRRQRESSGDDRGRRLPPRSTRRRVNSSSEEDEHGPREKRSVRQPSHHELSRNETEREQDSDDSDSDDDIRDERAPPPLVAGNAERRASFSVSQIKSASPCVLTADPKVQNSQPRGASPVPPVTVSAQPNSKRADKEKIVGHDDDSDSEDEDPQEESPREPTPRVAANESPAKLQNSREQVHSEHDDDDDDECKDADEHQYEEDEERTIAPPVQPKKKQETEYFDDDDEEDDADWTRGTAEPKSALKSGIATSNQAALTPHETGSRQEWLKSGSNGAIARDNNFVEEDWDAEDEHEVAQVPVDKNVSSGVVENPAKTSVGFGGVAADSNFAAEDWDD